MFRILDFRLARPIVLATFLERRMRSRVERDRAKLFVPRFFQYWRPRRQPKC